MKKLSHYVASAILLVALTTSCSKDEPQESSPMRPINANSNAYVTTLFEYVPSPGQFINESPGDLQSAQSLQGKKGMVSLGAWGGYIVLGFDHTVVNRAGENDLLIQGNAMESFAEPGIVWVMFDDNGNGKPDDTWYELAGSEFAKADYQRNYSVTYIRPSSPDQDVAWEDSKGAKGTIKKNSYHQQAYYPEWIKDDRYTLKGSLLAGKVDTSNPSYVVSPKYDWGYADNTAGGDSLDIANAVDNLGNKVNLRGVDFVKIQSAVQANMGWLGECSTDVVGVADISLLD